MGFTNYYYQTRSFTKTEWTEIVAAANSILAAAAAKGIKICGWDGTDEPVLNDKEIRLNGDGAKDLDHETFALACAQPSNRFDGEKDYFNFCKTARKPYDAVVVSILVAAAEIAPGALRLSSDGGEEHLKRTL